jgi:hypothetical protein
MKIPGFLKRKVKEPKPRRPLGSENYGRFLSLRNPGEIYDPDTIYSVKEGKVVRTKI